MDCVFCEKSIIYAFYIETKSQNVHDVEDHGL